MADVLITPPPPDLYPNWRENVNGDLQENYAEHFKTVFGSTEEVDTDPLHGEQTGQSRAPHSAHGASGGNNGPPPRPTPQPEIEEPQPSSRVSPEHEEQEGHASAPKSATREDLALWSAVNRSVDFIEDQARGYITRLLGGEPDADMQATLSRELRHVMNEARVQALVIEVTRSQSEYALMCAETLHDSAMRALMETNIRIKTYERELQWAETPEEHFEVAEQSKHLRAKARETFVRTLEMGIRRVDEQLDRTLHPSDPDFPVRKPSSGPTFFERFRDALRRPAP